MIHELRVYTLYPGKLPAYLDLVAKVSRLERGDAYGRLLGFWASEVGTLNQAWHLWEFASPDERKRLRAELAANAQWRMEYVPHALPLIQHQDIRILEPVRPPAPPDGPGHIYEFRTYRTLPGKARHWAGLLASYLPVRERYSPNVGLWVGEMPQPNEVTHLWAYPDLNIRMKARAEAAADPKWREFLRQGGPMLVEMQSTLLLPAVFSPMR